MARSDLLLNLVQAGSEGDQGQFKRALEGIIADERTKQHHVLADRLSHHLSKGSERRRSRRPISMAFSSPSSFVHAIDPQRRLDDLILPDEVMTLCRELLEEQERQDVLRSHGLEPRHRVLLLGPPGNGKTSLAEALAAELALPLYSVRYESLIGSFLGETTARMAKLFEEIRTRPCVLFFDEFDVVGKERGDVHETGEIKRVVSTLLLQIDQLPPYVIVVTATNHSELLDRAVWRRFQLRLELPKPARRDIGEWLDRVSKEMPSGFDYSRKHLIDSLIGLSFAELEDFTLDIRRRLVLDGPDANMRSIVGGRLRALRAQAKRPATHERGHPWQSGPS